MTERAVRVVRWYHLVWGGVAYVVNELEVRRMRNQRARREMRERVAWVWKQMGHE